MSRGPVPIPRAELRQQCADLGCAVPEEAFAPLACFLELLTQWNKVMNLVGTRRWQDTLRTLVVDSFFLAEFVRDLPLPPTPCTWDLGAGAGLPGIPLRMAWAEGRYVLVEAREKRALFLSTVLARVSLPRTEVFRGRAEVFFDSAGAPADMVISRAFMPWPQVLDLVRPHVRQPANGTAGGRVVFLTLEKAPAQPPQGWEVEASRRYAVGKDTRYFWSLRLTDSARNDGQSC